MGIITLTSDYGLKDHRVAALKGSLCIAAPQTHVVDISHEVEAYNLLQAAYILRNAYSYFPKGTVHVVCVDSFYHHDRKNIIAQFDGHYFICADNGLLSLVFQDIIPDSIHEITLNRFDDSVDFVGTDIFVPVAAHLAQGGLPEVVGRQTEHFKESRAPQAVFNATEGMIVGEVIYIDNFGNAVSNISRKLFEESLKYYKGFDVKFRSFITSVIQESYTGVVSDWKLEAEAHGKASVIFNVQDLLEITIYKGSLNNGASTLLGLNVGESVFIEFYA